MSTGSAWLCGRAVTWSQDNRFKWHGVDTWFYFFLRLRFKSFRVDVVIINQTFVLWDTGWTGAAGYPSHQLLQVGCWHFVSKLVPTGQKEKKKEKEKSSVSTTQFVCILPSEFTTQARDQDHYATVRPGRSRAPFLYGRVHRTSWMEWDYRHVEVLQSSPDDKNADLMIRQRCALRFSCFGFLLISLKPKFRKKTKVNDGSIQTDFSSLGFISSPTF